MASLSVCLTYAVKELGWLTENPTLRVKKLKESSGRDRILTKEEALRLIQAGRKNKNSLLYPILLLLITTGACRGEILGLTWDCIDFERGLVHLKKTKNSPPRTVALVGQAAEVLRTLYENKNPHQIKVFPSKKHFGSIDIRKPWVTACKEVGLENLRIHKLRLFCHFGLSSRSFQYGTTSSYGAPDFADAFAL